MKLGKRSTIVVVLILIFVVYGGFALSRESRVAQGPVDSSSAVEGESKEVAFVANAVEGTISLIDMEEQTLIGDINVIPDGRKVGLFRDPAQRFGQFLVEGIGGLNFAQDTDLSRDGRVLFVSRGFLADVAAFDIGSGEILWRRPVSGLRADHMTLSPDGKRLYVAALIYGGNVVEVLSSETGEKLGEFVAGQWPHDVHTSEDGSLVYVASLGNMIQSPPERDEDEDAYTITVVESESLTRVGQYKFEEGVRPFQVTKDGSRIYAQLSFTHDVIVHDVVQDEQIFRLELPVKEGVTEADWDFDAPHHGLAMTPDEETLCIAGRASDYTAVISTENMEVASIIDVGDAPSWAEINETGEFCVLANNRSDDVSIVSLDDLEVVSTIVVGSGPKHVTIGRVPVEVLDSLSKP